jgi:hypothetical protein
MTINRSIILLVLAGICIGFQQLYNYGKRKRWSRSSFVLLQLLTFGTFLVIGILYGFTRNVLNIDL